MASSILSCAQAAACTQRKRSRTIIRDGSASMLCPLASRSLMYSTTSFTSSSSFLCTAEWTYGREGVLSHFGGQTSAQSP